MGQHYEWCFRVGLAEVDAAGVIFFPRLFERAQQLTEAWLESLGYGLGEMFRCGDFLLPVVRADAEYSAPMRLGDQVSAELRVVHLGNSSLKLAADYCTAEGLRARTGIVHVCIDRHSGATLALPPGLRQQLARYQV